MLNWDIKYRPKTYEEVVGQDKAVALLNGELVNTYLLHGQSGSGKTTLGRIFSSTLNAEVIEMDASSMTTDDVRDLKKKAYYTSILSTHRVIIIDEAHALHANSWNALLKVIEEGPEETIWILCTTALHKVPEAIQNRSRLVEIKRIPKAIVIAQLQKISAAEGFTVEETLLDDIATYSTGSMRQAIENLQTYLQTGVLNLKLTSKKALDILKAVYEGDVKLITQEVGDFTEHDIFVLIRTLSDFIALMTMALFYGNASNRETLAEELVRDYLDIPPTLVGELRELQTAIYRTLPEPADTGGEQIIGSAYQLHDILMRNYNNFNDNRFNIRSSLHWFSTEVNKPWRK